MNELFKIQDAFLLPPAKEVMIISGVNEAMDSLSPSEIRAAIGPRVLVRRLNGQEAAFDVAGVDCPISISGSRNINIGLKGCNDLKDVETGSFVISGNASSGGCMFCPKCGKPMIEEDDGTGRQVFQCKSGDMPFAPRVSNAMKECFLEKTRIPSSKPLNYHVGGVWYCPACRGSLKEEPQGNIECPSCRLALNEFICGLVERHPHNK